MPSLKMHILGKEDYILLIFSWWISDMVSTDIFATSIFQYNKCQNKIGSMKKKPLHVNYVKDPQGHQHILLSFCQASCQAFLSNFIQYIQETQDTTAHHLLLLVCQIFSPLITRKCHDSGYLLFIFLPHLSV